MKRLLLIDGNNVMFRAYYATAAMGNLMLNKNGFPTNMIYAFINIYNRFIKEDFTHVVVAFDKGSKTRRHQIYKDYKAGREKTPDELFMQIPYIHRFLDAVNCHYYLDDAYEADDIIASFLKRFKDDFDEVAVLSNDNDLFQLISDNSYSIYTKNKDTIKYDKSVLFNEKGISPIQIPDYKGLIGDSSDNLKGVTGIGPKTASKLLSEYKSLEGIYLNIDNIKGATKDKLLADKDQAFFTKDMAILNDTFSDILDEDEYQIKEPDYQELKELYTELDFQSFLKKLPRESIKAEFSYKVINSPFECGDIISNDEINYLVLDTLEENYHTSARIGFGLSNSKGNYYIPFDVAISSFEFNMFLSDENIKKAVYDYKKIYVVLRKEDITINGVIFDSLLSSYLIDPNMTKDDFMVICNYFGYNDLLSDEQVYGKGAKLKLPELEIYSSHIAKKAFAIKMIMDLELKEIKNNEQEYLLNEVELPFSRVLGDMEINGLRVDTEELDEYEKNITNELSEIENEIYFIAGHKFNILSPKQLGVVLFEEQAIPYYGKKNKSGSYSTDASTLEQYKGNELIDRVLRYRMLSKLDSTYVQGVKNAILDSGDNKIHSIYRQALTDTGRLSSTEPNLQNLPIRNKEASEFRKIFIPSNNSYFVSCDYSQIELRVLAHMANEEHLINAFINGEDIHEATAKAVLHKNEVTKQERTSAKAVNFGIIYGMSPWGLSQDLGISPKEAKEFIDEYHKTFPNILPFTDSLIEQAKEFGFVKTEFNRRRYIRDINSPSFQAREFAKRTAMNAPIQGTAADILKLSMVKLDREIKRMNLHAKLILTIHDEVVLDVDERELDKVISLTKEVMSNIVKLKVPLLVEVGYGKTLYEAK